MSGEFEFRIKQIKGILDTNKMAKAALPVFVANTPVKSGNARRHTSVSQDTISAGYPYATRLDNGYSKQSPAGMKKPTIMWLKDYIKKHLGV
jgi:hypothetical protein